MLWRSWLFLSDVFAVVLVANASGGHHGRLHRFGPVLELPKAAWSEFYRAHVIASVVQLVAFCFVQIRGRGRQLQLHLPFIRCLAPDGSFGLVFGAAVFASCSCDSSLVHLVVAFCFVQIPGRGGEWLLVSPWLLPLSLSPLFSPLFLLSQALSLALRTT